MLVRPAACKHLPSQIKVLFFSDAHASISKKGRYTVVDSTLQASVDVQKLSGNDIFSALGSTPGGLSASEAEKRQAKEGKNLIEMKDANGKLLVRDLLAIARRRR